MIYYNASLYQRPVFKIAETVFLTFYIAFLLGFNSVLLISGVEDSRDNKLFVISWLFMHFLCVSFFIYVRPAHGVSYKWMLFFISLFLLSFLWSNSPETSISYGGMLSLNVVFCFYLASRLGIYDVLKLIWYVLITMISLGLLCWMLGLDNVKYVDVHGRPNVLGLEPVRGFFAHKVMAALYANIALILTLAFSIGWVRYTLVSIILFFIMMTGSSTGLVFVPIVLASYYGLRILVNRRVPLYKVVFYSAMICMVLGFFAYYFLGYFLELLGRDSTLTGRTLLWEWGIRAWFEKPILGWGFLGYFDSDSYYLIQRNYDVFENYEVPHFHNSFIQTMVDFGFVGIASQCWIFFYVIKALYLKLLHLRADLNVYYSSLVIMLLLLFAAITMHLFYNYNHFATFFIFYVFFRLIYESSFEGLR